MEIKYFLPIIIGCLLTVLFFLCKPLFRKRYKIEIDATLWLIPIVFMLLPSPMISKLIDPVVDVMPPISRMMSPYLQQPQNRQIPLMIKNTLVFAWVSIAAMFIAAIAIAQLTFIKWRNKANKVTSQVQNELIAAKQHIGIARTIDVYEIKNLKSPILASVFHPRILFPKNYDWTNKSHLYIFYGMNWHIVDVTIMR